MLRKNDDIEISIDGMSAEGSGVGRYEGQAVFVNGTAVGDIASVHIIKAKKNYAVGKINKIITPSKDRVMSLCPVSEKCGGCCFRHISYDAELRIKEQKVRDAFQRIGHLDIGISDIIGSPQTEHYRNKAQYPVGTDTRNGSPLIGFYAFNSHRIVPCTNCLLQPEVFKDILEAVSNWMTDFRVSAYDESKKQGLLRHIYIRRAHFTGEIMVCLVINGEGIPHGSELIEELRASIPDFKTFVININKSSTNVIMGDTCKTLYGDGFITDTLLGCRFKISPLSFYQVNSEQCEVLYKKAAEYADLHGDELLLDLYCGTGTIGLTMADRVSRLIGVEIIPDAVQNARENAEINGFSNAEFFCGDASLIAQKLKNEDTKPDIILIDPPRKGMGDGLVDTVNEMAPKRIVYISCDPATLARDCARFAKLGWEVKKVQPVDMFPHTAHVETVVKLVRKTPDAYINLKVDMDEFDLTASEAKATYEEIKQYILDKYDTKVSNLYIAQVKEKYGIIERENYNKSKSENAKQPQCPPEKIKMIEEALRHFKMI